MVRSHLKLWVYVWALLAVHGVAQAADPSCPELFSIRLGRVEDARKPVQIEALPFGSESSVTEYGQMVKGQVGKLVSFESYLADLRAAHGELGDRGADLARVDSVFYPLMGSDLALPLLVFPHARTVVTIDGMPFLPPGKVRDDSPIQIRSALGGAWRAAFHIRNEGSIASRLLGSLYEAFPRVVILSLDVQVERATSVSAVLRFDLGDGFGERTLVYINRMISPGSGLQEDLAAVWEHQPKAAIFKASMGIGKDGGYSGPPKSFGLAVIERIKGQGGLILEGLAVDVSSHGGHLGEYWPELSSPFHLGPDLKLYDGARSYILPDHPFGYDRGILVSDFSKPRL